MIAILNGYLITNLIKINEIDVIKFNLGVSKIYAFFIVIVLAPLIATIIFQFFILGVINSLFIKNHYVSILI